MASDAPATPSSIEARRPRARRSRARPVDLPAYLPARMVNEFVYCPRLFFYEWVEGVFAHSADTIEGALRHEKLERKADDLPPPEVESEIHSRSVTLASEELRLIATMDLVEGELGVVSPVDYKKGRPRDGDNGLEAWPADRVQVCAQAMILRENGYRCDEAVLFYGETKQRVRVSIDEMLVAETRTAIAGAREIAAKGEIPEPLIDSPKCPRCSMVGICLPDETTLCRSSAALFPDSQLPLFEDWGEPMDLLGSPATDGARRLVPARDDLRPLYVAGHGITIGKKGEVLQIKNRTGTVEEVRINGISQVNAFGNVQLTASAVQGLCWAEKPIAHFSYGGWFYGLTQGLGLKNVFLRRDQFAKAEDPRFCLDVARAFVVTKIRNQRTLLQRNHIEPSQLDLKQLKHYADLAGSVTDLEELLGIEGIAARIYFGSFEGMIKVEGDEDEARGMTFEFEHRNRRPPRDPINALLSFAYSLLAKDITVVCCTIGFDPFIGFFHQPRFGRPALALDLMEGFRPLIADSTVLTAINTGMVKPKDFIRVGPAVALAPSGRKSFLQAYEQRMDALVTHPLFGYRVNYRRVLEIQARLLARVVTGELSKYEGFETR